MSETAAAGAALEAEEHTLEGGVFYRHWRVPGARAVALLVHGLGEHTGRYQHVAEALAARGIASIAPDHVGHGRSPGQRCHIGGFGEFLEPLDALRAVVAVEYPDRPSFIIGHSMGGLIAGVYLLEQQNSFKGAVFSGAAFAVPEPPGAVTMFIYRVLGALLPKMGALALDASEVSRDPEVVNRYMTDPLVHDGKTSVGLLVALLNNMAELEKRRAEITLPVLVMHGEGDVMTPPAGSRSFVEGVGSEEKSLRIYPELYHEIFNEPEQEQVLDDMLNWLDARLAEG